MAWSFSKLSVTLSGHSQSGKSCVLLRYADNIFLDTTGKCAIGVTSKRKKIKVDNKPVKIDLKEHKGPFDESSVKVERVKRK